jgi:membrane protein DedA with SNARE-associated domain
MIPAIMGIAGMAIAYFVAKKFGLAKVPSNNLTRFAIKEKRINEAMSKATKGGGILQ